MSQLLVSVPEHAEKTTSLNPPKPLASGREDQYLFLCLPHIREKTRQRVRDRTSGTEPLENCYKSLLELHQGWGVPCTAGSVEKTKMFRIYLSANDSSVARNSE